MQLVLVVIAMKKIVQHFYIKRNADQSYAYTSKIWLYKRHAFDLAERNQSIEYNILVII